MGEKSRAAPAPPGHPARPGQPARPARAARPARPAGPVPGAAPSWGKVLATTLRLWLQRRSALTLRLSAAAIAVVVLAAGALVLTLASHPAGQAAGRAHRAGASRPAPAGLSAAATAAAATARRQAAAGVATQVSRSSVVACDPVMCSALRAQGVADSGLRQLGPSAHEPPGSGLVVSTAAVRTQLGDRLASVYAPAVLAAFGTGPARVEVLVTAPDGAAAYLGSLSADLRRRMTLGAQLLRNGHFITRKAGRAELIAGQVDARLLITLARLAGTRDVYVLGFGDAGPGSSYGVPLRSAELAAAGPPQTRGGQVVRYLRSTLAFFRAQRPPLQAAGAGLHRISGGQLIVQVEFAAPSPLGLLGSLVLQP
jgi:hypothetical protein